MQRLVIAAGGSGGHLFPAMRLARNFQQQLPAADILFVGSGLATSPYFDRHSFKYTDVNSAPWRGLRPQALCRLCYRNTRGMVQAARALHRFKPQAIIGFGSYHTLPVMAATWGLGYPLLMYEANTLPGKVTSLFSSYAHATLCQFAPAAELLKGSIRHVAAVGCINRRPTWGERAEAHAHYGLSVDMPTLLIAGGSQGALAVNDAVVEAISMQPLRCQVIHLAGSKGDISSYSAAYACCGIRAVVLPFEKRMDLAWAAADLFIGRAGASTIAELIHAQVPALLIPYPWSSDNHQEHNARFFTSVVGGGSTILQSLSLADELQKALKEAFSKESSLLQQWQEGIKLYGEKNTSHTFEDTVLDLLTQLRCSSC
jgi:UDP-N-acetylglucosamine--N-acetylmuramyl-(pentapeptide) pyrophosphoryl-undecaprenol N-acetylglucosamine transferase